jgi:acetylornithine/succinyldiaminopimelate/putrescine aminotransferase/predicted amino acid dehydrogenase
VTQGMPDQFNCGSGEGGKHPYDSFVNPRLGRALTQLALDKSYVRGEGCYLYDSQGRQYLDFLAQYGALPFGFNHPYIWRAVEAMRESMEPSFVQPSLLNAAGELARRLVSVAPEGLNRVTFTNSGAEAIEAAIKLCRSATGRHNILAAANGFHGKTLGALSATNKPKYQKMFGAPVPGFDYVPFGDSAALRRKLEDRTYAAFLVEPIQGEGGIVEARRGYLHAVQQICRDTGTLFVADEIQTGLGRTGAMFACEYEGVSPDVMTLAKALGGGLAPIGAVLSREEHFNDDFALRHTSTFAGNALACRVALAALDLLEEADGRLLRQVAQNGQYLRDRLLHLQEKYPGLISEVRGRGYMLGVKIGVTRENFPSSLLGCLGETEAFTPLIVSHMLNIHGVRLGYTLNEGGVLRIEPPLIAGRSECDEFLVAFEETVRALSRQDMAQFTAHFTGFDASSVAAASRRRPRQAALRRGGDEGRFAFLLHPLTTRNYADADYSLQNLSEVQLSKLAACVSDNVDPFVVGEGIIESATGKRAWGEFIVVPHTAADFLAMTHRDALRQIRMAAEMARDRGARIIGLGGFVSVVTRGGLYLKDSGLPALTTGNSYTAVASRLSIEEALAKAGRPLEDCLVSIVGATGSIGRALALMLAGRVRRLALIGNASHAVESNRRLSKIAAETRMAERIAVTCDSAEWLPQSDVIITATSSVNELVRSEDLRPGAIICDISRPPNVSREIRRGRPDVSIIDGGVVRLPGQSGLSFQLDCEDGHVYACMAETILLALERRYSDTSLGLDLDMRQLIEFESLAQQHGFEIAGSAIERTSLAGGIPHSCDAGRVSTSEGSLERCVASACTSL